ncbi:MAG: phosphoribosylglycinamide formyltransferase [Candidatus Poseidonia sp.]|nr:phosphoribosylglycinamide formyltransferase [Poseidonia sp.]
MPPHLGLIGRTATTDEPMRCAVLISGSGSGMEALVHAQRAAPLAHQTVLVISNQTDAEGVQRALALGLATEVVPHLKPSGERIPRHDHEAAVLEVLGQHNIEIVVLAGYMRLLSPRFLSRWGRPVVNIHPSLLPNFPGAHAHRDVLTSGATVTGCSIHLVDEGMDTGDLIAQACVPVLPHDDEVSLGRRVKVEEHRLYPQVLSWIAEGRVQLTTDGLRVEGQAPNRVC